MSPSLEKLSGARSQAPCGSQASALSLRLRKPSGSQRRAVLGKGGGGNALVTLLRFTKISLPWNIQKVLLEVGPGSVAEHGPACVRPWVPPPAPKKKKKKNALLLFGQMQLTITMRILYEILYN